MYEPCPILSRFPRHWGAHFTPNPEPEIYDDEIAFRSPDLADLTVQVSACAGFYCVTHQVDEDTFEMRDCDSIEDAIETIARSVHEIRPEPAL
jgi:hypothetical protein